VGAAFGVGDGGGVDVDAEVAVEGGEDFGEGDGAAVCLAASPSQSSFMVSVVGLYRQRGVFRRAVAIINP